MKRSNKQLEGLLESEGFKFSTPDMQYIRRKTNRDVISAVCDLAFRYCCIEAEYLGHDKKGKPFYNRNMYIKTRMFRDVSDFIKTGHYVSKENFNVSDRQITNIICALYKIKNKNKNK